MAPQTGEEETVLLLDLLMPPACLACAEPVAMQGGLCAACWTKVHFLGGPGCQSCGTPLADAAICGACLRDPPAFDRARAAFRYDDASKGLVLSFKHADRPGLARFLAPWMARAGAELLADADLLVPVPLHRWRLLHRRYNQAALLAQELSRNCAARYQPGLLRRVRHTKPQGKMTRLQRQANIRGAFRVAGQQEIAGRKVVLVDDVLTTGATIGACVDLLREAGAARVDVLTLARVLLPQ